MMRLFLSVALIVTRVFIVTSAGIDNVERSNFFNIELLQAVNRESDGNVIVAPLSVKAALITLLEGTGGRTRQELLSTLRLPSDEASIRAVAKLTLKPFTDLRSGTEISLATGLWIGKGKMVSINFNNALKRYNGDLKYVDFSNPRRSAAVINEWVRQQTKNNIQSIVEAGAINPDTHLLLTSALYFRGKWLNPFNEMATRNQCFQVPNVGCRDVSMMENLFTYKYAEVPSLDAEVVEIPYADGQLSMLVFLPRNEGIQSLHTLSRDLSYTPISGILELLQEMDVLLFLPKFNVETKLDLRSTLETMGIEDLFDVSANLTGILSTISAQVGSILHNAKIEVNEAGTVAAAVTELDVMPYFGLMYQVFRVDRPFLFAIVDRPSHGIMFAGRIVEPEVSNVSPSWSF